jgi:hypothetical protein
MTERCLKQLKGCRLNMTCDLKISVTEQGSVGLLSRDVFDWITPIPKNVGFAFGMNQAISSGVEAGGNPDFVLCFNNDLEFPKAGWLRALTDIAAKAPDQVLVPGTDRAAIRVQPRAINKQSFPVAEASAYCWLIPFKWCQFLKKTYGFWLFDEDFAPAYGEDNWTAFLLSKQFGPKPFRYVPRSFVRHLRARTSSIVKHDRANSNRVLVDKLRQELKDPSLRSDLQKRAKDLIRILSNRL